MFAPSVVRELGLPVDERAFMVFSGWPHVGWAFLVMSGRTTTFRE